MRALLVILFGSLVQLRSLPKEYVFILPSPILGITGSFFADAAEVEGIWFKHFPALCCKSGCLGDYQLLPSALASEDVVVFEWDEVLYYRWEWYLCGTGGLLGYFLQRATVFAPKKACLWHLANWVPQLSRGMPMIAGCLPGPWPCNTG